MPYLETIPQDELRKRFAEFPIEIKDIVDLLILFSHHNTFPSEKINTYKDNIEVFGLGGNERLNEYPYFDDNFFIIHMPFINEKGLSVLMIEMVDYNEPIDIKERKQVIRHLKRVLPSVIDINKIIYIVR